MKKIQWNLPIIERRFMKYHKRHINLVLFPWLECALEHEMKLLSWIRGLVGSNVKKELENHLFGYMHNFHLFLIHAS